ncbi:MAG: integrase core domain-containing protein [Luteibacter jiangsuensis]
MESWRRQYNEARPHDSCGRIPPRNFCPLPRPTRRQPSNLEADALTVSTGTAFACRSLRYRRHSEDSGDLP